MLQPSLVPKERYLTAERNTQVQFSRASPFFCRSRQLPHGFLELVFHLPKGRVAIDRTRRFNPLQNDLTVDL